MGSSGILLFGFDSTLLYGPVNQFGSIDCCFLCSWQLARSYSLPVISHAFSSLATNPWSRSDHGVPFVTRRKNYQIGQITDKQVNENVWKNVFQGKLTYVHFNKGEEMAPTVSGQGGSLLVRRLPTADPKKVFVGDVVALKDPQNPDNCIVRRLAAVEGDEMVSTDEKDEPFVLENDQCWVVSDNESLSPKVLEAADSRLFGPVPMSDILGRVIYCLRSSVDHGPIRNSETAMQRDSPVLAVELDIDELARSPKT